MCGFMIKTYSWMGNTKPIGNRAAILHKCGMDTKSIFRRLVKRPILLQRQCFCCWVYRIFSVFHTGRWKQQEKLTNNHGDSMFARGRHENRAMKTMWFQPINAFECWQWCFRQIVHVFIPGLGDDHGWSIRFFDLGDGLNYQAVATDVGVHWNVASGE